jgi:hypothetical protein
MFDACQFVILHLFQFVPEAAIQILPKQTIGRVILRSQPLFVALLCEKLPTCLRRW